MRRARVALPGVFAALATAIVVPAFGLFVPGASFGVAGPVAAAPPDLPDPPSLSAQASYAVDADTGVELYARNADEPLPPGSTIKIATALVVVAHAELDDEVTIEASDEVDPTIYSSVGVAAGETLTVEQLLYGMLLPSGSDAAKALARHVGAGLPGGDPDDADASRAAFVEAMNDLAEERGLTDTRFANPTGDDAPNQHTTARELAVLATELLQDETLAEIVRTPVYDVLTEGRESRVLPTSNSNKLLQEDAAVVGVKTGSTPDAGACLVAARTYGEGNRVVAVVLGSTGVYGDEGTLVEDGRWDDMTALFAGLDEDYVWVSPAEPETLPGLAEEMAVWGVELGAGPSLPVPVGKDADLRYRLVLGPEADPGDEVGAARVFAGEAELGELPLYQAAA